MVIGKNELIPKYNYKMKKSKFLAVICALACMFFSNVRGQITLDCDTIANSDNIIRTPGIYSTTVLGDIRANSISLGSNDVIIAPNRFMIFNKDVTEVITIDNKGNFYYTPRFFCECRKCRKFKGRKKLNIN